MRKIKVKTIPYSLDDERSLELIIDGKKVLMRKVGKEYQGLCPWHKEKTPSFIVTNNLMSYHCFGCSTHGDLEKVL